MGPIDREVVGGGEQEKSSPGAHASSTLSPPLLKVTAGFLQIHTFPQIYMNMDAVEMQG